MNPVKLKSVLNEQLSVQDPHQLERACKMFAKLLMDKKIVQAFHKNLTAADVPAVEYSEELADAVRDEILAWINTINARGGR